MASNWSIDINEPLDKGDISEKFHGVNFAREQSRRFNHRSAALNVFPGDARPNLIPDKTFLALLETKSIEREKEGWKG